MKNFTVIIFDTLEDESFLYYLQGNDPEEVRAIALNKHKIDHPLSKDEDIWIEYIFEGNLKNLAA